MINNHKASIKDRNGIIIEDNIVREWKIQLTTRIGFISLDTEEICAMDLRSDNVEITMGNEAKRLRKTNEGRK